ncbi:hypothetical protein Val02_79590 [Virgisporangium aliadipatigenens]|uniref:Uncharacterized protein n=1 Tax=Virgisporangium aliadipatigenens TaxID=741659 RepID=A0A8J4DVD8_9ACTN|nr:hypothetical protein [Virgisporangium aliadipatigenens]GIJ51073.1 hypothetical protein Val02_79590 [Virgisporangium aliadipatigenens]
MAYVNPDSALVQAADDLLVKHVAAQPGGPCVSCGQVSPCASARNAAEVRRAAGLTAVPGAPVSAPPTNAGAFAPSGATSSRRLTLEKA